MRIKGILEIRRMGRTQHKYTVNFPDSRLIIETFKDPGTVHILRQSTMYANQMRRNIRYGR